MEQQTLRCVVLPNLATACPPIDVHGAGGVTLVTKPNRGPEPVSDSSAPDVAVRGGRSEVTVKTVVGVRYRLAMAQVGLPPI